MQYLFVDGGHLRVAYEQVVPAFFGEAGDMDYSQLLRATGSEKAFIYDCIDDIRHDRESDAQFTQRVTWQEQAFDAVQALPYFHVRLGQEVQRGNCIRQLTLVIL